MVSANELANDRSDPGIFLFNAKKQLTFTNEIAWDILSQYDSTRSANGNRSHGAGPHPEICTVIEELEEALARRGGADCPEALYFKRQVSIGDTHYAARALIIAPRQNRAATYFLLLLDRIVTRRALDLGLARMRFQLSPRELEIVKLLLHGLTNKQIGGRLKIAESTVKDYLRKVMTKVGSNTRSGVVSRIMSAANSVGFELDLELDLALRTGYVNAQQG